MTLPAASYGVSAKEKKSGSALSFSKKGYCFEQLEQTV